jgi:hypothetical protein
LAILPALLRAQSNFRPIKRQHIGNAENGDHVEVYRYATLADHFEAVTKPLNEAGLLLTQDIISARGGYHWIQTRLIHAASGEWLAGYLPVSAPVDDDPHVTGSRLTYGRRHALQILLGLAPQHDDDDGNVARAEGGAAKPKPAKKAKLASARPDDGPPWQADEPASAPPPSLPSAAKPSPNQVVPALLEGLAVAQDPGALWLDHEDFLRGLSEVQLEDLFDRYVGIVGDAPPAIDGLVYPEGI